MSIITDITPKNSGTDDKTIPHDSITGLTLHHLKTGKYPRSFPS
ncbi:hypothetical protein L466_03137 [Enterobacter sp. BIDMC 30]|nr:hypothetical protein L466_03137 [Enterobacter sp. BIDMC 30]